MSIIGREYFYDDEQYVVDMFYDAREAADCLYDIKTAREDLEYWQETWDDVPEDLTPERLMEIWNELVCSRFEHVVLPNGRSVPRYSVMTEKQIAEVIHYADDWSEVEDLVDYLDGELHFERNQFGYYKLGWDDVVEDWCKKNM